MISRFNDLDFSNFWMTLVTIFLNLKEQFKYDFSKFNDLDFSNFRVTLVTNNSII